MNKFLIQEKMLMYTFHEFHRIIDVLMVSQGGGGYSQKILFFPLGGIQRTNEQLMIVL